MVKRSADQAAAANPLSRRPSSLRLSVLRHLDANDVSARAIVEVKRREAHLPPIVVYRWWARRTEAVFGSVLEAAARDLGEGLLVVDPFAGGGVVSLAAARRGHRVYAQDVNPWAARGLASMLRLANADELRKAYDELEQRSSSLLDRAYGTHFADGSSAHIAHTLRVAVSACSVCGRSQRMFPHALVSLLTRKERGNTTAWLACQAGHLFRGDSTIERRCPHCRRGVDPTANYTPSRTVTCPACGHCEPFVERTQGQPLAWEVVLVERVANDRRELSKPIPLELRQAESPRRSPTWELGRIDAGRDTAFLRHFGIETVADLYPKRQRYVLEQLLQNAEVVAREYGDVGELLKTLLRGTAEMAGYLSRWDRYYLKSYEAMAGHRYNFTTLSAEPNVWGAGSGRGTFTRRVARTLRAVEWMEREMGAPLVVRITDVGGRRSPMPNALDAWVVEGGSQRLQLDTGTADVVLTDPPYHDDVQYGELSLPLLAWSGITTGVPVGEAVAQGPEGFLRDGSRYRSALSRIFKEIQRVLKPEGHLVLTFANRNPRAWVDLFAALQEAGFEAIGYEIVHAENETGHRKQDARSCNLDLILDLVTAEERPRRRHRARSTLAGSEADFLRTVGTFAIDVGSLPLDWERALVDRLGSHNFIARRE